GFGPEVPGPAARVLGVRRVPAGARAFGEADRKGVLPRLPEAEGVLRQGDADGDAVPRPYLRAAGADEEDRGRGPGGALRPSPRHGRSDARLGHGALRPVRRGGGAVGHHQLRDEPPADGRGALPVGPGLPRLWREQRLRPPEGADVPNRPHGGPHRRRPGPASAHDGRGAGGGGLMRVLIADKILPVCAEVLRRAGIQCDHRPGISREELLKAVADVEGIVVRSDTRIDEDVLRAAPKLRIVGRAGAGVDNIDVPAATRRGIVVMNAPGENTISAAEHTLSLLLALARQIPQADRSMKAGRWDRGKFLGVELFGKVLGILGMGKVGREVASRARAFGMQTIGYDPVLSEEVAERLGVGLVPLDAIFERSDFITLHLPLSAGTRHLIGRAEIARCRPGVRILNVARGGIVDESALLEGLQSGKVAGAALDVFETEPPANSPLLSLDSVILTPHLGASTQEAQEKVAVRIAEQMAAYLKDNLVTNAVNMEGIDPRLLPALQPYRDLCERLGKLLSSLARGPVS